MNIQRALFFTDNCESMTPLLEGVHELHREYPKTLTYQHSVLTDAVAGFNLIIIEAEAGTMRDALETCRHLRSKMDRVILFVASLDDEVSALEAYDAGADEYIIKPISPALFHAKLESWQRWSLAA